MFELKFFISLYHIKLNKEELHSVYEQYLFIRGGHSSAMCGFFLFILNPASDSILYQVTGALSLCFLQVGRSPCLLEWSWRILPCDQLVAVGIVVLCKSPGSSQPHIDPNDSSDSSKNANIKGIQMTLDWNNSSASLRWVDTK